ncbi:High affinity cAMP-specific 3',5'-cyclic phosphodiesterase 7A [Quaeritorhiza haematococci]|nr:High affinity cAMP-specific 3',5'-cyclic phosphodiesterase 7A [Quaeritorhiza haematococci]
MPANISPLHGSQHQLPPPSSASLLSSNKMHKANGGMGSSVVSRTNSNSVSPKMPSSHRTYSNRSEQFGGNTGAGPSSVSFNITHRPEVWTKSTNMHTSPSFQQQQHQQQYQLNESVSGSADVGLAGTDSGNINGNNLVSRMRQSRSGLMKADAIGEANVSSTRRNSGNQGNIGNDGSKTPLTNVPAVSTTDIISLDEQSEPTTKDTSNLRYSVVSNFLRLPGVAALTSIYSSKNHGGIEDPTSAKATRARLANQGHPIRGPILSQIAVHYLFFLLLLVVAYTCTWVENIRFFMAFFYFNIAGYCWQISRIYLAKTANSVMPFYISLVPFGLLIFISREAHMIVMVLWYVSFLVIYLQSGHQDLKRHLIAYTIIFMGSYLICVFVMSRFYQDNCRDFFCGVGLRPEINFSQELVLVAASMLVVGVIIMLERFIKLNASTLLERENYMTQLYLANIDLRRQLRQAKSNKEVDLEAPLAKATQILKDVRESPDLDETTRQELEFIAGILSSDQLYNPNLYQKPADADVHNWLNDMLLPQRVDKLKDLGKERRHHNISGASSVRQHSFNTGTSGTDEDASRSMRPSVIDEAPPLIEVPEVEEGPTKKDAQPRTDGRGTNNDNMRPSVIAAEAAYQVDQLQNQLSPSQENLITLSPVDTKAFEALQDIDNPTFDVHFLEEVTNGHALLYIGWYIFRRYEFFSTFNISEACFKRWITKVERGYRPTNPYHNATHAADVTHSMHYYVSRPRIWPFLTPEERLASIFAPIVHDYMHPGYNNAFLINTIDPLTVRYNDQSVLENFHIASVYELMRQDECNIFCNLSHDSYRQIREMALSMVLATDMAMHFEWIGKFKSKMASAVANPAPAGVANPAASPSPGSTTGGLNFEVKGDRKLLLNFALKCADVNNPAKPQDQCTRWTDAIMEEFFRQGDEEKRRGVPVSMFMNRETTDIPKCQIEDVRVHMENIQNNKQYWKLRSERASHLANLPTNNNSVISTTNTNTSGAPMGSQIISSSSRVSTATSADDRSMGSPRNNSNLSRYGRAGFGAAGSGGGGGGGGVVSSVGTHNLSAHSRSPSPAPTTPPQQQQLEPQPQQRVLQPQLNGDGSDRRPPTATSVQDSREASGSGGSLGILIPSTPNLPTPSPRLTHPFVPQPLTPMQATPPPPPPTPLPGQAPLLPIPRKTPLPSQPEILPSASTTLPKITPASPQTALSPLSAEREQTSDSMASLPAATAKRKGRSKDRGKGRDRERDRERGRERRRERDAMQGSSRSPSVPRGTQAPDGGSGD